jgi:hypothetical protein
MDYVSFFGRQMVWQFLAVSFLSAVLLGFFIRCVIRLVRQSFIVSVPLLAEQEVEFPDAGRIVLCIEGPLFTRRFARLGYELSAGDGAVVSGRPALFRSRTSGFSTVRMELKVYEIPRPGLYFLRISGLTAARTPDPRERIVFMRPHLARSIGYIIGIVLFAGFFITGLVFALLCFVSN